MEKPKTLYIQPQEHELRGRASAGGWGAAGQRGIKGRKNWDNCNSIINKIDLKKRSITPLGTVLHEKT